MRGIVLGVLGAVVGFVAMIVFVLLPWLIKSVAMPGYPVSTETGTEKAVRAWR